MDRRAVERIAARATILPRVAVVERTRSAVARASTVHTPVARLAPRPAVAIVAAAGQWCSSASASALVWCTVPWACSGGAYAVAMRSGASPTLTMLWCVPARTNTR